MKRNNIIKKGFKYLFNKRYRTIHLALHNKLNHLSDEKYLKKLFYVNMGKKLDLVNPKTYNEKLQWLKLYDRNPKYSAMVDKYDVKEYVSSLIGEKYIVKTLGVWERFEDIVFDSLPERFVLKCTHDSGGIVVCKSKKDLDLDSAKEKINRCMSRNYYYSSREWPYKNIKPRIIAEEYLEDSKTSELRDYKLFCFNGQAKMLFIATDRQTPNEETKFDFFDMNYNHLPFTNGHPNAKVPPEKPECFDEMKKLAEKLSVGIPQVRIDFYEVDGRVYFGEITFFHWGGMTPFDPEEWDYKIGEWIDLPEKQI